MTKQNESENDEIEFPFDEHYQSIDNYKQIYQWLENNDVTGAPVKDDLYRLFDRRHNLKPVEVCFRPEEGTLSVKLLNPIVLETPHPEADYYNACIENSPDGYHMHVETQEE